MRLGPVLPLAVLVLIGCRPLDVSAPVENDARRGQTVPTGGLGWAGGFRVIDGDTFELSGETIRIANIDTPEMPPRARCWAEARLARAAAEELDRLRAESSNLGRFRLDREGRDRYGRTLAKVTFDGQTDAGEALIASGYAVPWVGRRWDWCGGVSASPEGARVLAPEPSYLAGLTGSPK